jgi:hypothetical protein
MRTICFSDRSEKKAWRTNLTKVAHNTEANTLSAIVVCVGLDHQSHFSFHFLTIKANENTADLGRELFMSTVVFARRAVGFDAANFTRAPVKTQK